MKSNFQQYGQMEKQRSEASQKRKAEERRSEKRKSQKKEHAGARKGRTVATNCVFPMFCVCGRSKSRLAKAAGSEPCGKMRDEQVHAVLARSTFESQNAKNGSCSQHTMFGPLLEVQVLKKVHSVLARNTFGSEGVESTASSEPSGRMRDEKLHAVLARSTCRSQNVQNMSASEHF